MYEVSTENGSEDAYSIVLAEYVGFRHWSTEEVSDENAYNLLSNRDHPRVVALNINWDNVNTAKIRRSYEPVLHWAGRLDGRTVSITDNTRFGQISPPLLQDGKAQLEYLRLDGPNQLETKSHRGKLVLLVVTASGALVATSRECVHWKNFLKVVRGIGVSPVSLQFDFSALGKEDECHTSLASKILSGYYTDDALRFLLEMLHKGRLHVHKHSPNRCYVPKSSLKSHGLLLGVAMPSRAFRDLVFCCRVNGGKADRSHMYWKPTKDGNLFQLKNTAMNLVEMEERQDRIERLEICTMKLRRDVG